MDTEPETDEDLLDIDMLQTLEWERDAMAKNLDELVSLLRKVRAMIRKPKPDLEFIELLIEREIGF